MFETPDDIAELQDLLDRTMRRASPHMDRTVSEEHRLTAQQMAAALQGNRHVAFTAVDGDEPRASPLNALFIRGRFTMLTTRDATKVAHLRANPACSAVHIDADRITVVVNGRVEWLEPDHADHDLVHRAWTDAYGSDPYTWGDVVLFRIRPVTMWTYAPDPSGVPGGDV